MTIQALQDAIEMLRREVKAAWISACEADGIDPASKFVVLTNTTEAAAYNELMGLYLGAKRDLQTQLNRNKARRERYAVPADLGLKRVKGALGGVYYE